MTRSRRRKLARQQARGRGRFLRTGLPVASALLAAVPVVGAADQAQGQATTVGPIGGTEGLQEVVVTAQKRVENLQSVPISVQVFDTEKLDQLGIVSIDDYVKYSPSLSYVRGQGEGSNGQPGDDHIYIRGVVSGGDGNHSGSQPSVGVYFDEEPVTTIDGTPDVHIYDVQRIEVLEGPQGTLFGASSESGTVRIITNKPDPTRFAAGYDLQGDKVSDGGSGYEAQGFVNIPLSTSAAVRLVGWYERDPGYISNVAGTNLNACIVNGVRTFPTWSGQNSSFNGNYPTLLPCPTVGVIGAGAIDNTSSLSNDYNTVDTKGGRAALRLDLNENWTVTPTVMAQDMRTNGFFGYDPGVGTMDLTHYGPEGSDDSWYQAALTIEGKMSNFDLVYATAYMKRTSHTIAEYSDYSEFYDRAYGSGLNWVGNDGKPIMPEEFVIGAGYFEKWSHELRLSTPAQYPVKATIGVFVQRQLHNIWQLYTMPGYEGNPYGGNPQGLASALSIPGFDNAIWLTDEQRVDRDQAVFAQVTWDISPEWSLTGGERYYKYDNSLQGFFGYSGGYDAFTGFSSGVASCFAPPMSGGLSGAPCSNLDTRVSDTGTVPRVNLTYKPSSDLMLYATYSKGFRPGGVNRVSGAPPYAADYLTNYEVGWKTQWLDHRVRWNGALFWEDWKNFQFSFLVPPSITAIANGGNARIKGLENELDLVASDHLLLTTNVTFLDPRLTQDYCGTSGITYCPNQVTPEPFLPGGELVGPLAPAGTNLPVAPKFKGNIVARYTWGEVNQYAPYAQAAFVYQTQVAPLLRIDEAQILGTLPAYGLLDLAAGVNDRGTNLEFFINNATNKIAQLSRFTETNPVNDNQIYILPAQPRTFGIKFSQKF
jgi:iron complex outermembrane recepter protein